MVWSVKMAELELTALPEPRGDRTRWPWAIPPDPLPFPSHCPKLTIVIPSYNQGEYLEATLRSILFQGYPDLEVWVIDGGSSDRTLDILRTYDPWVQWISEPDQGQSDAVNKGLRRATGDWIGWQNSDDTYAPNAFAHFAHTLTAQPHSDVIYGQLDHIDAVGNYLFPYPVTEATVGTMIPYSAVTNHAVFFHRKVIDAGEGLDLTYHHCMDQEFILRLLLRGYRFTFTPQVLAQWRLHDDSKSTQQMTIWAREAFRLCQRVYDLPEVSPSVRAKARDCLYSLCADSFAKGRLAVFREQVAVLRSRFSLTLSLRLKAILAQIPGIIHLIRWKARLHGVKGGG
jgi:glycosyltransferase involved in cell wall biosynthesis